VKRPLPPGTPINGRRYGRWVTRFGSYRSPINNVTIQNWLEQFAPADRDLAARILDVVEFYDQAQIYAAYRRALEALPGWHRTASARTGTWRFAAMSGSTGESGDAMLYHFRVANQLDAKLQNELFVSRSDLFRQPSLPEGDPQKLGQDDVVVLLDDFSGTGTQVCKAWNDPQTSFGALLAGVGKVYLIVVAASKAARDKISDETSIRLVPAHDIYESDNVFSEKCRHFTSRDHARIVHYGEIADKRIPKGFGDCGYVVVFQHRAPNNSIPILHADHRKWTALFPRHG
jgi:hypothetical protein